jgi:hypothetical protein
MSTTALPEIQEAEELIDRAKKLPPALRERIVLELIHSAEAPPNSDADWEYWKSEIARRIEAVRNGTMKTYSLDETMEYLERVVDEDRKP